MPSEEQSEVIRPPYISYTTLTQFVDIKLGGEMLPPRIDRGFLDTYAGSVQAQLLQALRVMGLIAEDGRVQEPLRLAARHPSERKQVFRAWAESFYVRQQELAKYNGTAQMLHESFAPSKYTGSTLRKAIVFYLTLADDVGLKKSPHFKPPRQSGAQRARKQAAPTPAPLPEVQPIVPSRPLGAGVGEQKTISLGEAGTVTITVDVRWLDLPMDTFTKLRAAINQLDALARQPGGADKPEQTENPAPHDASLEAVS